MELMLSSWKSTSSSFGNGVDMPTVIELKAEAEAAGLTGFSGWDKAKLEAELDKVTFAPAVVERSDDDQLHTEMIYGVPLSEIERDTREFHEQRKMVAEREHRRQARRDEEAVAAANRANDQAAAKAEADREFRYSRQHGNIHE